MISEIINVFFLTCTFTILDRSIAYYRWEAPYYLLHSIHNAGIVYLTTPDVYNTIFYYGKLWEIKDSINIFAAQLVFALHIYHILVYWRKFRYDDWLHHILMIGIALPIGVCVDAGPLLGFSLFFTTGLPGCIDYFLLFLTRNRRLDRDSEKVINAFLNTWIRAPGTCSHAILTFIFINNYYSIFSWNWCIGFITAILNYWNGQYFMAQIVYDAGGRGL